MRRLFVYLIIICLNVPAFASTSVPHAQTQHQDNEQALVQQSVQRTNHTTQVHHNSEHNHTTVNTHEHGLQGDGAHDCCKDTHQLVSDTACCDGECPECSCDLNYCNAALLSAMKPIPEPTNLVIAQLAITPPTSPYQTVIIPPINS